MAQNTGWGRQHSVQTLHELSPPPVDMPQGVKIKDNGVNTGWG